MALFDDLLIPYAPSSEVELLASMGRDVSGSGGDRTRILQCANRAHARIERYTRRRLTERIYREPVSISCGLTTDVQAITGAGFLALKVLDEVLAASGVPMWTRVGSIASDVALTLSRPANSTGAIALSFGSAALRTTRISEREILIPEFPVNAVYSVKWVDSGGAWTTMDLTGAVLQRRTGLYYLPNDTFPDGAGVIAVECSAGYRAPTGAAQGDVEAGDLQQALHRLTAYLYGDETKNLSRAVASAVGPMSFSLPSFRLPDDVADILKSYRRLW